MSCSRHGADRAPIECSPRVRKDRTKLDRHDCDADIVALMRLLDHIAQYRKPLIVEGVTSGRRTRLSGAADYAGHLAKCPMRYVLTDDLVRLCAALVYSKGARALDCADLLHIPGTDLWVEWAVAPWRSELTRYGIGDCDPNSSGSGRRGAWIRGSRDGRRGQLRTFWTVGENNADVFASSMEAYFDLDAEGTDPDPFDGRQAAAFTVFDDEDPANLLRRCFRFRYVESWAQYYAGAALSESEQTVIGRRALGTIAIDVPLLIAFFLLLGTRASLPQRPPALARLNRARIRLGKSPLLDHVEVSSPLLQPYQHTMRDGSESARRSPRLHYVRGHLFRHGSQLLWRVPHMRGSARMGTLRSRTVIWTFDRSSPAIR